MPSSPILTSLLTLTLLIYSLLIQVAVNSLLGDTPTLVEYGSALMSNLATKEVKAVVRYIILSLDSSCSFVFSFFLTPASLLYLPFKTWFSAVLSIAVL